EKELAVLHCAGEVPVVLNHVRRFVVVLLGIPLAHPKAPVRWFAHVLDALVRVKCRHALFGEAEVVGAVEVTLLGLRISAHGAVFSRLKARASSRRAAVPEALSFAP